VANALKITAFIHGRNGSISQALHVSRQALSVLSGREGMWGRKAADIHLQMSREYRFSGAPGEGILHAERALKLYEKTTGIRHPVLAEPLSTLAGCSLDRGDDATAISTGTRALALTRDVQGHGRTRARAQFIVARALWRSSLQQPLAMNLATLARDFYRGGGPHDPEELGEIEDWLETREKRG
jgi:hypothetical protein